MKLKQLLLISIATLSLGGSLYGMEPAIDGNTLEAFFVAIAIHDVNGIRIIAKQHPTIVNAYAPAKVFIGQRPNDTALDYAIRTMDPDLVQLLLGLKSNINAPGKDYLGTVLRDIHSDNAVQILHLLCSAGVNMDDVDYHAVDDTAKILQNHINTRLAQAIVHDNVNEVQRIITKYNININQELPLYGAQSHSIFIEKNPHLSSFIPLHMAVGYERNNVARLLINDLNADVTIIEASSGGNALHNNDVNFEIAQLLITKGCNPNVADNNGRKPLDMVNNNLTPEMLGEIRHQPERVANFYNLQSLYGGSYFSWKWIGGGAVVVVAVVAAKKLYDWYYKKVETEDGAEQNESEQKEADKDKTANQIT
jgi:hypothetical protein